MATIFQNSTFKLNYMSVACLLSIIYLEYCCNITACYHYLMINPRITSLEILACNIPEKKRDTN